MCRFAWSPSALAWKQSHDGTIAHGSSTSPDACIVSLCWILVGEDHFIEVNDGHPAVLAISSCWNHHFLKHTGGCLTLGDLSDTGFKCFVCKGSWANDPYHPTSSSKGAKDMDFNHRPMRSTPENNEQRIRHQLFHRPKHPTNIWVYQPNKIHIQHHPTKPNISNPKLPRKQQSHGPGPYCHLASKRVIPMNPKTVTMHHGRLLPDPPTSSGGGPSRQRGHGHHRCPNC